MPQIGRSKRVRGFTLLEMMLVIAIIGILAAMSVPRYRGYVTRAREAVFQENLYTLRACLRQAGGLRMTSPQQAAALH